MNPLATELNDAIEGENPHILEMLSELGREQFFPKGILAQSGEAKAKAKKFNATIGMAIEAGHTMSLGCVMEPISGLAPDEALRYAPVTGIPELRAAWRDKNLRDNPSLEGRPMSLPIVTNGLTHALSIVGDLFCDPGGTLVLPDKLWGNYRLIFGLRRGVQIASYPFFSEGGGYDVDAFRQALRQAGDETSKIVVLLNFPNNPTGYTPTKEEGEQIAEALIAQAQAGTNVVAMLDDAYFGLFYEPEVMTESLFTRLAGAHERLLAVKGDAATKEAFVWGLRVGFLSFGLAPASAACQALEKKVSGAIRSVVSNGSMLSQRVVLKALQSPRFSEERRAKRDILCDRALEVKRVLADPKYAEAWDAYPFNSGYFMCVRLKHVPADDVRRRLLDAYGIGTIAAGESDLRVAFSCLEKEHIAEVFDTIHRAAAELA